MTSFSDIPIKDIEYLLKVNNLSLSGDKYLTAWNFILTNPNINVPISIADWIIAHNLVQKEVNIPVMTYFDIITSKNKLLNLPNIINVMSYLHKLDERDPFKDLPNEVVAKILSELDCDQILSLCKLNKRFNFICTEYKRLIFDKFLLKQGYNLTDYDPKIICKALKLNQRVTDIVPIFSTALIDFNDRIIISFKDYVDGDIDVIKNISLGNINNIISIHKIDNGFLFLNSFGEVYTFIFEKETVSSYRRITHLNNIVQIVPKAYGGYFLDINGTVFSGKDPVIKNISKILYNSTYTIFIDKNNDCYGISNFDMIGSILRIGDLKKITKIPQLKNTKNIFNIFGGIVTISNNNLLTIYVSKEAITNGTFDKKYINPVTVDLNLLFKNITKIVADISLLYILADDKIYTSKITNISNEKNISNVNDFVLLFDGLLILSNDGYMIYYSKDKNIYDKTYVGTNAKLLSNEYILKDSKIYYIKVVR